MLGVQQAYGQLSFFKGHPFGQLFKVSKLAFGDRP